jgi:hypothetical protein
MDMATQGKNKRAATAKEPTHAVPALLPPAEPVAVAVSDGKLELMPTVQHLLRSGTANRPAAATSRRVPSSRTKAPILGKFLSIRCLVTVLWLLAAFVPCVVIVRGTKIESSHCWLYGTFIVGVLLLSLAAMGFSPRLKGKGVEFQAGHKEDLT